MTYIKNVSYKVKILLRVLTCLLSKSLFTTRMVRQTVDEQLIGKMYKYYRPIPELSTHQIGNKWQLLDLIGEQLFNGELKKLQYPVIYVAQYEMSISDISWMLRKYGKLYGKPKSKFIEMVFKNNRIWDIYLFPIEQENLGLDIGVGEDSVLQKHLQNGIMALDDVVSFPGQYSGILTIGITNHHILIDTKQKRALLRVVEKSTMNDTSMYNRYSIPLPEAKDEWEPIIIKGITNYLKEHNYAKGDFI